MNHQGLLVSIVNHENTQNALELSRGFRACAQTLLIDSGSNLTNDERRSFDVILPNVYYSGLFNESLRQTLDRPDIEALLFVCSDVQIDDPSTLAQRMMDALADASVGVYTPSARGNSHAFCRTQETKGLREIPFVDGFIFGLRRSVLEQLKPVDLDKNLLGWGIDVYSGYVAASMGLRTVVDDGITVHHPQGSGYDRSDAFDQMLSWLSSLGDGSRRYYAVYQRLYRLSRFGLSRFRAGRISRRELAMFRKAARTDADK